MTRPRTAPPAATPTQVPTALPRSSGGKMVVITESVTGMMNAAATPITMRSPISVRRRSGANRARGRREPKSASPSSEERLAAEAVADRAGGQQQRGEGERVGVDDPLELRLRARRCRGRSPGRATLRLATAATTIISARHMTRSTAPRRARVTGKMRFRSSECILLLSGSGPGPVVHFYGSKEDLFPGDELRGSEASSARRRRARDAAPAEPPSPRRAMTRPVVVRIVGSSITGRRAPSRHAQMGPTGCCRVCVEAMERIRRSVGCRAVALPRPRDEARVEPSAMSERARRAST